MSYYTSLTGLRASQTNLNVIANNIANADTGGFKKSRASFSDIVAVSIITDPSLTTGIGTRVSAIKQDFALGPIEQTGSALDLAINGEGFFSTRSTVSGKISFTRTGSYSVDGAGFIANDLGERLQVFPVDAAGAVDTASPPQDAQIPLTNAAGASLAGVSVSLNGVVMASYADATNSVIGGVALARFIAPQELRQLGAARWAPTAESGTPEYGQPTMAQFGGLLSGSLERSNVDIAEELVGLITAQRNFQANAKAIDTATQISQTIINLRT